MENTDEPIEVVVALSLNELGRYKRAYPGLLDNARYIRVSDWRKAEGIRVKRVFITMSVDPQDNIVAVLHHALVMMPRDVADALPIYLREPHLRS